MNFQLRAAVAGIFAFSPIAAFACASCGCTLSSDWESMGYTSSTGFKLDIRYDYLNQNQLRSGTSTISSAAASQITNNGNPQEVEKYTKNNYVTLGLDYSTNPDWGVNLQLPYINRSHSTLGTASDGTTPGPGGGQYDSKTSNIGDVKMIGRYQGFTPQHNLGVQFGMKLPTGSYKQTGTSTDPTAPGAVPIDRGLQPGTGTTDLILGAYYADAINKDWDYFTQITLQKALNSKDQYKPGDGMNLNVGLRYMGFSDFTPLLQLNARRVQRDSGANADTVSTGGTLVYVSQGVVIPVGKQMSVYSFVQLPVYQNVNGVQLAPRYTFSLGARYAF
ncbi:MAG TPA: TonB-dependent receptor [Burkholderiaceae bacterium]